MLPGGDPNADSREYVDNLDRYLAGLHADDDLMREYLFTREWIQIDSDAKADAFVRKLWTLMTVNERRYVYHVYRGLPTAPVAVDILLDKIAELEEYSNRLELEREEELEAYRQTPVEVNASEEVDTRDTVSEVTEAGDADSSSVVSSEDDAVPTIVNSLLRMYLADVDVERRRAFTDVGMVSRAPIMVAGGSPGHQDPRLRKLIAFMDAVHDFSSGTLKVSKETIKQSLKVGEMPTDSLGKSFIHSEDKFVSWLDNTPTLYFGDEPVQHTLHGRHLSYRFDVHGAMKPRIWDYWSAYRTQVTAAPLSDDAVHCDVWCMPQHLERQGKILSHHSEPKNNKAVVYLCQIADIIVKMKSKFGGERTFIVDKSEDQLSRMIIASGKLDLAIGRLFIVRRGRVCDEDENVLVDESKVEIGDVLAEDNKWKFKICDANLIDGNLHLRAYYYDDTIRSPEVDNVSTGCVSMKDDLEQMSLEIEDVGHAWKVHVDIEGERTTILRKKDAEEKDFKAEAVQLFTIDNMKKEIQTMKTYGVTDVHLPLAKKRLCDWGQVEHCKKNGHVFVSSDRLPCLYALNRNVDVVFMSEKENKDKLWPDNYRVVNQKTFAMIRKLTDDEIIRKMSPKMQGAGNGDASWMFACASLVAVTLASAACG